MNNPINPIENQFSEDEISLFDIIQFLIENWKQFIGVGILGGLGAGIFLMVTPAQYEAIAQIQVSQIVGPDKKLVNVEEPNQLVARMKTPSSYSIDTAKLCVANEKLNEQQVLDEVAKAVKLSVPKGLMSVVDFKISTTSKTQSLKCAQAIFENIQKSQQEIASPSIERAKAKLALNQQKLESAKAIMSKADGSGAALSAAYLVARDEIRYLTDEVNSLEELIQLNAERQTKLIAPIYVADKPVFPKRSLTMIVGIMAGLFLGLMWVFGRKLIVDYRLKLAQKT